MLISLSEHLDFLVAYLIAAAAFNACNCGLSNLPFLVGCNEELALAAALRACFAALYFLLQSEDDALMLGSLLLFGLLALASS